MTPTVGNGWSLICLLVEFPITVLGAFAIIFVLVQFGKGRPSKPNVVTILDSKAGPVDCLDRVQVDYQLRALPVRATRSWAPKTTCPTASDGRPSVFESVELQEEWDIVWSSIGIPEREHLAKMRSAVRDCDSHPACRLVPHSRRALTLLRFLRARDGHAQKAAAAFRASLDWRHEFRVDDRVQQWREEFRTQTTERARAVKKLLPYTITGLDFRGVAVLYFPVGMCDVISLDREASPYAAQMAVLSNVEEETKLLRDSMFRHRTVVKGSSIIYDVGQSSFPGKSNNYRSWIYFAWYVAKYIAPVCDSHYPETLGVAYACRMGPATHRMLSSIMGPLVAPETRSKFRFFSINDDQGLLEELMATMPEESIPGFLRVGEGSLGTASLPCGRLARAASPLFAANTVARASTREQPASSLELAAVVRRSVSEFGWSGCCCGIARLLRKRQSYQTISHASMFLS